MSNFTQVGELEDVTATHSVTEDQPVYNVNDN